MNEIFTALLVIALFFLLRELFTWWLKQNKIVEQNNEIIRLLRKLANEPDPIKLSDIKRSFGRTSK